MSDTINHSSRHSSPDLSYFSSLKASLTFHKYFKYTIYLSQLSFITFIIVHITQVDTFFSASYFSFFNWLPIIMLVAVLIVEWWWNAKLLKKISEIMFYEINCMEVTVVR